MPSKEGRQPASATSSSRLSPAALQLGAVNFGAMAGSARRQALRNAPQQATSIMMKQDERPHMLHVDASVFDLSYWHYKPWWWQPPMIVGAGVAFVIAANILDEACMKTTILACCTVGVWWGVCLYALPSSFRNFATQYIDSHDFPEDQLQKQVQDVALCCVESEEQGEQCQQDAPAEVGAARQMAAVQQQQRGE